MKSCLYTNISPQCSQSFLRYTGSNKFRRNEKLQKLQIREKYRSYFPFRDWAMIVFNGEVWKSFWLFWLILKYIRCTEIYFKGISGLALFSTHEFFWVHFLGAHTGIPVSKTLWLQPWSTKKNRINKYFTVFPVQQTFTCSKSTTEILEKCVKSVQI